MDIPPFRSQLKRGERYVKLYRMIVTRSARIVATDTVRSYQSKGNVKLIFTSKKRVLLGCSTGSRDTYEDKSPRNGEVLSVYNSMS